MSTCIIDTNAIFTISEARTLFCCCCIGPFRIKAMKVCQCTNQIHQIEWIMKVVCQRGANYSYLELIKVFLESPSELVFHSRLQRGLDGVF